MLAIAFMFALLATPFVLWAFGLHTLAVLTGIYMALSTPSIVYVLYLAIKNREWPKITGGPSIRRYVETPKK